MFKTLLNIYMHLNIHVQAHVYVMHPDNYVGLARFYSGYCFAGRKFEWTVSLHGILCSCIDHTWIF